MSMNNLYCIVLKSRGLWLLVAVEGYSLELMVSWGLWLIDDVEGYSLELMMSLWSNVFYFFIVCFT